MSTGTAPRRARLMRQLPVLLAIGLFALAARVLHDELAEARGHGLMTLLGRLSAGPVAAAILWTVVGHLAIASYDLVALAYLRHPLPRRQPLLAGFVATVFSQNIGLSVLSGGAIRYRMYTAWGLGAGEIARLLAFNAGGLWLGFFALTGTALTLVPIPADGPPAVLAAASRPAGLVMLALCGAALAWAHRGRPGVGFRGFVLEPPRLRHVAAQLVVSAVDWLAAASVLHALLVAIAPDAPPLPSFLGLFLAAQGLALLSHVPGGVGVFETLLVLMLRGSVPATAVLAAALAYRCIYYLGPLFGAVLSFGAWEALLRRRQLSTAGRLLEQWLPQVVPRVFAASTLVAGIVLLVSGATPSGAGRIEALARILPLRALEMAHFMGSVVGGALVLTALASARRLDGAYVATMSLLAAGALLSVIKGLDWEEASILTLMLAVFAPCRSYFDRTSSVVATPFSVESLSAVGLVAVGVVAVTLFAHRHTEYSHELWWRFALEADAPRSLRALVGSAIGLGLFGLARLFGPARRSDTGAPAPGLEAVAAIVADSPSATAHLALLGDKELLVSHSGRSFLMYAASRGSLIAMGDPVGPPAEHRELVWRLRELADRQGRWTVFYEVRPEGLPLYVDLGLTIHKIGEEARVPLAGFGLEGKRRADLRQALNRMAREGGSFELIPAEGVPPLLDELEAVSAAWLAHLSTREKRFSLGWFDRAYLARTAVAVVRHEGRIVAFANLWRSGERNEVSIDLMRHVADAPHGTMTFLFTEIMRWAKGDGYRWFVLGMAPLSGVEAHRLAPLWNRVGALLYRHGERFYNFRGLRAFKGTFDPVWEPRFIAGPGGLATPLVLGHLAALVSGSIAGALRR